MDYPKDSDMMEVFECQKTQTNKYVALIFIFCPVNNCPINCNFKKIVIYVPWFCTYIHVQSHVLLSLFVCRYKLLLLKPCTKALSQSTKISLRMDHRGFLSLQCMILTEDKQVCFVEFLVRHACVEDLVLLCVNIIIMSMQNQTHTCYFKA